MKNETRKKLIKAAKLTILLIVFGFIAKYLYNNVNQIKNIRLNLNYPILVVSIFIFWVYKITNALLWHMITVKNNCSLQVDKAVKAWMYSLMGKFIPGKVFYLGGRVYFYQKEGISALKVSFCFIFENICTLLAAAFLFIISLLFTDIEFINQYKIIAVFMLGVFIVLINPYFFKAGINLLLKLFKKGPVQLEMRYRDALMIVFLFIVNWCIQGLGFFMLVNSIYPLDLKDFFFVSGSYALACIIGIISLFAPSGIGVRESIMVLTLKNIIPEPVTVVITIVARLWATVGEISIVFLTYLYSLIFMKKKDVKKTTDVSM